MIPVTLVIEGLCSEGSIPMTDVVSPLSYVPALVPVMVLPIPMFLVVCELSSIMLILIECD